MANSAPNTAPLEPPALNAHNLYANTSPPSQHSFYHEHAADTPELRQPESAPAPNRLVEFVPGQKRVAGLLPHTFWLLVILVVVIITAAVGGGVGGSLAVQRARAQNIEPLPAVVTVTVNPNASSSPNSPTSNPTPSLPSSTKSSTTSSTSTTGYTIPPPSSIPFLDIACPGGDDILISHNGNKYKCYDKMDLIYRHDVTGIVAYTLQQCIDACSTFNLVHERYGNGEKCDAVVLQSELALNYGSNLGANCWLKYGSIEDDLTEYVNGTAAEMCSPNNNLRSDCSRLDSVGLRG